MTNRVFLPLCVLGLAAMAENSVPARTVLFQPETPGAPLALPAGGHVDAVLPPCGGDGPVRRFLRVVGGVSMPGVFKARGEENFRDAEYLIDDRLDPERVDRDRYSLLFKGNNEEFERLAFHRISGELLRPGPVTVSARVIRRGFAPAEESRFGVWVELFLKREGRDRNDVYDAPDALLFMPVAGGDGPFVEVAKTFDLPENVAAAVVVAGGSRFRGECRMEAPRLAQEGTAPVEIPFVRHAEKTDDFNYWVGMNLSTRSWPVWNLSIDGETVFEGAVFDRASNVADFYLPLPPSASKGGALRLALAVEETGANFPYDLRSVELIEESARPFEVCHAPRFIAKGGPFGVLVETNKPGVTLRVKTPPSVLSEKPEVVLGEPGLHALRFTAMEPDTCPVIEVGDGTRTERVPLGQIVEKGADGVCLSVGDDIYIDKVDPWFAMYVKWYAGERMGNFYQFRPSYQWSGFRRPEPAWISRYLSLFQGLNMPHAWQVEGRTLAGKDMNPPVSALASPLFHGKQAHENDGGYYYWQHFVYEGFFSDMAARTRPYGGIFAKHRPIYTDKGVFIHYDPHAIRDMAQGAQMFVENLRYSRGESTRHTGPSVLFRYFYQAGYDWLGAEQMYGPEETVLSALRGASRAYHKEKYGSLHAMQWGSFPYTDPKHSLRFYLSLATAYMHGSSHINTEDALWLDEYANDRFSESGRAHIAVQHKMLDFIETHQRRGELSAGVAVLQGRNDAWKSFGRGSLWSQKGPEWAFNKACESFDLLKVFYPGNTIDACGPDGWFTATPHGPVDIVPVEADGDVLKRYKAVVFLGWNTYVAEDFARLAEYARQGGTLILSAAHINSELAPEKPPVLPKDDGPVRALLGDDYRRLDKKTVIELGAGRVVYFPQPLYPAGLEIKKQYVQEMKAAAAEANKSQPERGWVAPKGKVSFTAWDQGNRRTLYLLNTDWDGDRETQAAELALGGSVFPLEARRCALETVHCADGLGVMPLANTTDVLEIMKGDRGWRVKVQTTGPDTIRVFNAATGAAGERGIAGPGLHELAVE